MEYQTIVWETEKYRIVRVYKCPVGDYPDSDDPDWFVKLQPFNRERYALKAEGACLNSMGEKIWSIKDVDVPYEILRALEVLNEAR